MRELEKIMRGIRNLERMIRQMETHFRFFKRRVNKLSSLKEKYLDTDKSEKGASKDDSFLK